MKRVSRRQWLQDAGRVGMTGLLGGLLPEGASGSTAESNGRRPNIIFILIDDLGWAELGCYGNTFNRTPHLDGMAERGMRFTHAYSAAPVCSPTRAALMSGQHPVRVGITDYLRADDENFFSPDHVTWAEQLQARGYKTGLIGKWHLMGDYAKRRGAPSLHGFDEVICSETSYIAGGKYFHPYFFMKEVKARREGEYLTDRLNTEAVDFITRHKREPFALYLSHYAVHTRLSAKRKLIEKYKKRQGAGRKKNNPILAAMIESIDEGVGQILAKLRELRIDRDTVVVFTSDNGGEDRVTSNAPLRGGKSQLYEGGIRVPLIVRWPGVVRPNTVCDVPVDTMDFYPTFLDVAGAQRDPKQVLDGESLVPLLKRTGGLKRDALYWHYPLAKPHFLGGRNAGAIRAGDYKLIEFYDTGKCELYHLGDDPGERRELTATMPGKVSELRKRLANWRKETGARMTP